MASPQVKEGFTRIANELLDALCRIKISGNARQIFDCILRKTYGYGKKQDKISLSQFEELTGIPRKNCPRSIRTLEAMEIIFVDREKYISNYSINKDYEMWRTYTNCRHVALKSEDKIASKLKTNVLKSEDKTALKSEDNKRKKDNITKETLKKLTDRKEAVPIQKKSSPKKESTKRDFIGKIITVFSEEYFTSRGIEYHSNGVDRSAVGKLLKIYKNSGADAEQTLIDFRIFFEKCLMISDKWYWENMTLPIINSKINEIKLKLGMDNGKRNTDFTEAELRDIAEDFANDPRLK